MAALQNFLLQNGDNDDIFPKRKKASKAKQLLTAIAIRMTILMMAETTLYRQTKEYGINFLIIFSNVKKDKKNIVGYFLQKHYRIKKMKGIKPN